MKELALSHSRLSTYKNCPRKFQLQYLKKAFPDDSDNPNFVRGNRVHGQLENYVMWLNADKSFDKPKLGQEALNVLPLIDNVYANYTSVLPEQQVCIDKDWKKTGWFASNAYYRAILDVIAFGSHSDVLILDYKTGKVRDYDGFGGQLHLNAAMLFAVEPSIQKVDVAYLFVDHKQTIRVSFERSEYLQFREYFTNYSIEVNALDRELDWKSTINQYCKWCAATQAQCKFSKQL